MAKYLRKECGDLNEEASDNDDDKDDDDDANSKDAEVVEIGTGEALLDRLVKLKYLSKGGKRLSCSHERQIREDKS